MKVGKLKLEVLSPEDLDARVQALTGCVATEVRALLDGHCIASTVAKALSPFLAEERDIAELAHEIAAAGVTRVQRAVTRLYDKALRSAGAQEAVDGEA
jgi:hypothetical protein